MQRIDTLNVREDLFGPGKAGFHDNADLSGQDATYLSPDWLNAIQEELCNLLELSGVALNPESKRQLFDLLVTRKNLVNDLTTGGTDAALTAEMGKLFFNMFSGGDKHFRIPNPATGKPLIIQTDIFAATLRTGSVNFPIAFPNRFLAAVIMHSTANETQLFYAGTTVPRSLSSLGYVFSANPNGGSFQYIAIGD